MSINTYIFVKWKVGRNQVDKWTTKSKIPLEVAWQPFTWSLYCEVDPDNKKE